MGVRRRSLSGPTLPRKRRHDMKKLLGEQGMSATRRVLEVPPHGARAHLARLLRAVMVFSTIWMKMALVFVSLYALSYWMLDFPAVPAEAGKQMTCLSRG